MDLQAFLALIGVLLTAITIIPIIRELASHRERTTVSLAREVLSGDGCSEYQRQYWTNAMNDALRKMEARRAFPAVRGIIALGLYLFGTLVLMGAGWLIARAVAFEQIGPLIFAGAVLIFGEIAVLSAIHVLSDIRTKRSAIYGVRYSEKKVRDYYMTLFGVALYLGGLGLARGYGAFIEERDPYSPILFISVIVVLSGLGMSALVINRYMKLLSSDKRADEHLVPTDRPISQPEPHTWKTVRRYLVTLFILDLFTRKKTG